MRMPSDTRSAVSRKSAFALGWESRIDGKSLLDNPFPQKYDEWEDFRKGWLEANKAESAKGKAKR